MRPDALRYLKLRSDGRCYLPSRRSSDYDAVIIPADFYGILRAGALATISKGMKSSGICRGRKIFRYCIGFQILASRTLPGALVRNTISFHLQAVKIRSNTRTRPLRPSSKPAKFFRSDRSAEGNTAATTRLLSSGRKNQSFPILRGKREIPKRKPQRRAKNIAGICNRAETPRMMPQPETARAKDFRQTTARYFSRWQSAKKR